jgi:hypothetical protein
MSSRNKRSRHKNMRVLAVAALRDDGTMGTFAFDQPDTCYERSGDGDLIIIRGPGHRQRVVGSFPPGRWCLVGWLIGMLPDGDEVMDIIEVAPPQLTGDPEAVEAASTADREWFAANPGQHSYLRDALPGEWSTDRVGTPPVPGAVLMVEVRQHTCCLRTRIPAFWAFPGNPQPEDPR